MKIGFVVPVYKTKREYLNACVESLIHQTYQNLQIVLVDDCSPDNCGKWCEEFATKDSRIKVVHHEKNKGLPAARNTGIDHLDNDVAWVSFVDSDDWLELDSCERFLEHLSKHNTNPEVVIFSGYKSYPNLEQKNHYPEHHAVWETYAEREALQIEALSGVLKGFHNGALVYDTAWAKFCSKQFLINNNIRFRALPYREDGMFFQEIIEHANKVTVMHDCLYHYRMVKGSMVNSFRKNAPAEQNLYLTMLQEFAQKHNKSAAYRRALYGPVIVAIQIVITQHYFNKLNPLGYFKRYHQCRKYLAEKPFCDVFKNVPLKSLHRNFMVKMLCVRIKWYAGLTILRNLYLKKNNQSTYD